MENAKKLYQALLNGKTLVNNSGERLTLENSLEMYIGDPEKWTVCNEWKMKPAAWYITIDGAIGKHTAKGITQAQKFGLRFHTKEAAKKARDEMREANLLRYWASVIDPEWKPDWGKVEEAKYYIFKNRFGEYKYDYTLANKLIGTVYMSKKAARKICDALDSGELVIGDKK